MDNAYYILAKKQIDIERLHICTWEFPNESSYIEFGIEFPKDAFVAGENSLEFFLAVPFIKKDDTVTCLMTNLSDRENSRFIFNDVVNGVENVGKDARDGSILKFETRKPLTILPCKFNVETGLITITIKKPEKNDGDLYTRILVKLSKNSIAIKKSGIAQSTYIYDFKINETRNLPQDIYDIKKQNGLELCNIQTVFCFHAVPDDFEFSFVNSDDLRNIRKLESSSFQKYLPNIKSIKKDCYNIIFLKKTSKSNDTATEQPSVDPSTGPAGGSDAIKENNSFSFFTICTKETIGTKQIALAIGANILCCLLFAMSSIDFGNDTSTNWYSKIPWEYWVAFAILFALSIYLSLPVFKKIGYLVKELF